MSFTLIFALIFLLAFAVVAGFAFYLSRTIEHGEARFDAQGRIISDTAPRPSEPARPAQRIEQNDTMGNEQ